MTNPAKSFALRIFVLSICLFSLEGIRAQGIIDGSASGKRLFDEAYQLYKQQNYSESFPIFYELATHGYTQAYGYMGLAYELGEGVDKDFALMCEWYDKAIQAGHGWCGWRLGKYLADMGQYELALNPLVAASQSGGGFKNNAALMLGHMYEDGKGVDKDAETAATYYRQAAADLFSVDEAREGLARLGMRIYDDNEFKPATPEMIEGKTAKELYDLGYKYETSSFERNAPMAYAYFMASADMDYPEALEWMGYISTKDDYPIQSKEQARKYFDRALEGYHKRAQEGNPAAYSKIGDFYRRGLGRDVDLNEAVKWYEKGAELDNTSCQLWLGQVLDKLGDYHKALESYERAGAKGQGYASYLAGEMYENGRAAGGKFVIVPDLEKAVFWYGESAKTSNHYAEKSREALTRLGY